MLVDTHIDLLIGYGSWKHYRDLGYDLKTYINSQGTEVVVKGQTLSVRIEDITPGNNIKIKVRCDYCGKEFEMAYYNYYRGVMKGVINKVACRGKCSQAKLEESNFLQFGVKTPIQRDKSKKKMLDTMINRYGVEYAAQDKEINKRANKKKLLNIEDVYNRFREKGLHPLFYPTAYKGVFEQLPYMCSTHRDKVRYTTLELLSKSPAGCPECGRELVLGENHHMWEGGISHLHSYVRSYLNEWKGNTLTHYDNNCIISGDPYYAIHHLYGFNMILEEALNNLCLDVYPEISMYSHEDLDSIIDECKDLHSKYGYGVPLSENIHDLFHNLYGYGNNTPEQFEEFKIRYRVGEFDELLAS